MDPVRVQGSWRARGRVRYLLTNNTSTSRRLAGRLDVFGQAALLEGFGDSETLEVPVDCAKVVRQEGRQLLLVDPLTKTFGCLFLKLFWGPLRLFIVSMQCVGQSY